MGGDPTRTYCGETTALRTACAQSVAPMRKSAGPAFATRGAHLEAVMGNDVLAKLMQAVRESIERVQSSAPQSADRGVARVLAHLWSAYDELELLAHDRFAAAR